MSALFSQAEFSGGLFAQFDASKSPENSYPLLVDARIRTGVVSPTRKHVKLSVPAGKKQGIFVAGQYVIVFIAGEAYYGNISGEVVFQKIANWTTMNTTVERISCTVVPVTTNFLNKAGTPDSTTQLFNQSIQAFPAALFCFDGVNRCQAILPNGTARVLNNYDEWLKDNPEYVPVGSLPAVAGNKLFLASADKRRILHSVSGRVSDFVVNLDPTGNKGGDAETIATAVSYNEITAIRALSSGHVLVGTLYGTFLLELDYTRTIFGEPFLQPIGPLFASGPVNEISLVEITREGSQDTAFISQSGIHSFNAVAQAQRESNNFSLGAKIRGLLVNPQSDSCAAFYDDYALFAVNTIHGYGVLVYDTTIDQFASLDLSFGRVKQFAATRLTGEERLFYITHDDQVYEGFASEEKNTARLYLGDWTPSKSGDLAVIRGISAMFTNVRTSGQAKLSIYADRQLRAEVRKEVTAVGFSVNTPVPIPYVSADQVEEVGAMLDNAIKGWRIGALLEWNFDGDLTDVLLDGEMQSSANTALELSTDSTKESLVFTADSGYVGELCPGGTYNSAEFVSVDVTQGAWYAFHGKGDQILANGKTYYQVGLFKAASDKVAIKGTDGQPVDFTLRSAAGYKAVLDRLHTLGHTILHGGDFAYPSGTDIDAELSFLPIKLPIYAALGNHDIVTDSGKYTAAVLGIPRYYSHAFEFVDVFFFNSNASEPDGVTETSTQADYLRRWVAQSTKPFKIVVMHHPPYTNDINHTPGRTDLRWINGSLGIKAVLTGHAHKMERFVINDFPYFVCGAGGNTLRGFAATVVEPAFADNTNFGYLLLVADALSCRIDFCDVSGNVLDTYVLYA